MTHEIPTPEPIEPAFGMTDPTMHGPIADVAANGGSTLSSAAEYQNDGTMTGARFMANADPLADIHAMEATDDTAVRDLRRAQARYWLTGGPVGSLVRSCLGKESPTPRPSDAAVTFFEWVDTTYDNKKGVIDPAGIDLLSTYLSRPHPYATTTPGAQSKTDK
jgi:hypothetical protein